MILAPPRAGLCFCVNKSSACQVQGASIFAKGEIPKDKKKDSLP